MNLVEVKLNDRVELLRFNQAACIDFEQKLLSGNIEDVQIFINMVYAGVYGEATRNDNPPPLYDDVYNMVIELSKRDDYQEQSIKIQDCYNQTKWGKDLANRINKISNN